MLAQISNTKAAAYDLQPPWLGMHVVLDVFPRAVSRFEELSAKDCTDQYFAKSLEIFSSHQPAVGALINERVYVFVLG